MKQSGRDAVDTDEVFRHQVPMKQSGRDAVDTDEVFRHKVR